MRIRLVNDDTLHPRHTKLVLSFQLFRTTSTVQPTMNINIFSLADWVTWQSGQSSAKQQ